MFQDFVVQFSELFHIYCLTKVVPAIKITVNASRELVNWATSFEVCSVRECILRNIYKGFKVFLCGRSLWVVTSY